jgi:Holliday junction resolvase RusA-like endonuclease
MRGKQLVDVYVEHEIGTINNPLYPEWEKLILETVWKGLKAKKQLEESLSIRLEFFMTKNRYEALGSHDLDNMVKVVIDSLNSDQGRKPDHPIYDDSYVINIEATKAPTDEKDFHKEKTHIEIWEWNESKT